MLFLQEIKVNCYTIFYKKQFYKTNKDRKRDNQYNAYKE